MAEFSFFKTIGGILLELAVRLIVATLSYSSLAREVASDLIAFLAMTKLLREATKSLVTREEFNLPI